MKKQFTLLHVFTAEECPLCLAPRPAIPAFGLCLSLLRTTVCGACAQPLVDVCTYFYQPGNNGSAVRLHNHPDCVQIYNAKQKLLHS